MLALQTILVPTDFSEAAAALRLAGSLARDHGARVVLLHAAEPTVTVLDAGLLQFENAPPWAELRGRLDRLAAGVGVPVECRLARGKPAAETLRAAEEIGCDLIVMGTQGKSGLMRVLFGSVAEEVLRHATCPVLTVRTPPHPEPVGARPARGGEAGEGI